MPIPHQRQRQSASRYRIALDPTVPKQLNLKTLEVREMKNILTTLIVMTMVFTIAGSALADLNDGLVTYYPFNGNANDESVNSNNATVYGASLTTDRFGNLYNAYSFDGIDDKIVSSKTSSELGLSGDVSYTIAAWININSLIGVKHWWQIVGWGNYDAADESTILGVHPVNECIGFIITRFGGGWSQPVYNHVDLNQWYFVVGTYDKESDKSTLYINGILNSDVFGDSSLNLRDRPIYIGYSEIPGMPWNPNSFQPFNGAIDDIRIYNRALSEFEIHELYNEGNKVEFSNFRIIKTKFEFEEALNNDMLEAEVEFTLNDNSDGIDPLNEDIVIMLDNSALTIPAGSFIEEELGEFKFEGTINSANAKMEIETIGVNTFKFKTEIEGFDLTGTANPVNIRLLVGNDIGEENIRLAGELEYEEED